MEKETLISNTTEMLMAKVRVQMEEAFTLGMKYKRLSVVDKLVPILRENEFSETTIALILQDIGLLEDETYADIFAEFDTDNI
jgi:hypothetical protein